MNTKDLKTFIFDLDGTLLNSEKRIDPRTLETIKKLQKEGKRFSINTGRTPFLALEFMDEVEPDFPCSFCNGAIIYDWKNKKFIEDFEIDYEDAKKAYDVLVEQKSTMLIYTDKSIYYKKFIAESKWVNLVTKMNNALDKKYQGEVLEIDDNFNLKDHKIYKILCIFNEVLGDLSVIEKTLASLKQVYPLKANADIIDIIPLNRDKGSGLKYFFDHGYADIENTCVFGDENNDVPMFEVAKYSVCMGNARDDVKAKATWVTDTNNENGIGKFLEKTI